MNRRDWLALKPLAGIVGISVVALVVLAALVSFGVTQFIVPTPESTAEGFLRALKAHRFEAAREELSGDLKQQVTVDELRAKVRAIEEQSGGIADAQGDKAEEQGQMATAEATVKLGDRSERVLEFPLQRENGVWRLTSVEPLESLAGS